MPRISLLLSDLEHFAYMELGGEEWLLKVIGDRVKVDLAKAEAERGRVWDEWLEEHCEFERYAQARGADIKRLLPDPDMAKEMVAQLHRRGIYRLRKANGIYYVGVRLLDAPRRRAGQSLTQTAQVDQVI